MVADLQLHPLYTLLKRLLEGIDQFELPLDYDHSTLLKLAQWNQIQKSTTRTESEKLVRPGELLVQRRHYRINNLDKPIATIADYNRRKRRGQKKDMVLFERFLERGIPDMVQKMIADDL